MGNSINNQFKMRRHGGQADRAAETSPSSYSMNQERTMANMGMAPTNYGTPNNKGTGKPKVDEFGTPIPSYYKPAPGTSETIGMPYEGPAFTGRKGSGESFKEGKKVPDWSHTENFAGTRQERNVRLSGETKVTKDQPKYIDQPGSQRRKVKGATIEQYRIK